MQFPLSVLQMDRIDPFMHILRVVHWRPLFLNRMDGTHKSWPSITQNKGGQRGRKCAAKSDSSTFTVQIKVSAACQLDYQMAPAALQEMTCYIFSDVCALPGSRCFFVFVVCKMGSYYDYIALSVMVCRRITINLKVKCNLPQDPALT